LGLGTGQQFATSPSPPGAAGFIRSWSHSKRRYLDANRLKERD
jgi:hypothetical protein